MKIAAWNVNSLNVRLTHLADWLNSAEPDVVALQETKLEDHRFPRRELEDLGYESVFIGQKSYNGVAILSRVGLSASQSEFDDLLNAADQRRVIAATVPHTSLGSLRVVNVYVVNGQAVDSEKYEFKLRWLKALRQVIKEQLQQYPNLVVLGDFNIAPSDQDCYDPSGWRDQILCSEAERSALSKLLELGLHDSYRLLHQSRAFSWWDYRQGAFARDQGLRIDLALISDSLRGALSAAGVDKEPRSWAQPSDHAPVWLELT